MECEVGVLVLKRSRLSASMLVLLVCLLLAGCAGLPQRGADSGSPAPATPTAPPPASAPVVPPSSSPPAPAPGLSARSWDELRKLLAGNLGDRNPVFTARYGGEVTGLKEELTGMLEGVLRADDYLNYSVRRWKWEYVGRDGAVDITFEFEYWTTREQEEAIAREIARILPAITGPGMTEHHQLKAVHDYIVSRVAYDTSLEERTAYGALFKGRAVCQGYSMLAYRMLAGLGMEVRIVEGEAGGTSHAWNLVRVDGRWYHVDLTWNDPVPDEPGRVRYSYYGLTDHELAPTHTWERSRYPQATSPYHVELATAVNRGTLTQPAYQDLMTDLELHYLLPEYTARDRDELEARIRVGLHGRHPSLDLRYLDPRDNIKEELAQILNALGPTYRLQRWSYSLRSYERTPEDDVLVFLEFQYRGR